MTPNDTDDGIDIDEFIGSILDEPTVPVPRKSYWWEPKKCECGGDKTYGPNSGLHSDWCPKKGYR